MTEGKKRKLAVIVGSDSDLPQIAAGINLWRISERRGLADIHFIFTCSAHRNPEDLDRLLIDLINSGVDCVITAASKLAALFGDADAHLRNKFHNTSVHVIALPLKGKTKRATTAAV